MAPEPELQWDDLRYFLRAAQAGTLSGAARAMGVQHSTIGRRLSALERALGAPLFIRSPDGLHLTPLAQRMLPLAEEVERAVLAVHGSATQRPARVRLAMPSGFTQLFMASLPRLRQAYPQLTLELLTGVQVLDLHKGQADLALRSGQVAGQAQDLVMRPVGESGFSLYAAPAYLARKPAPADCDALSGHELIGYDPAMAELPAAQWVEQRLARAGQPGASLALRSREMIEMRAAAVSGAGLALLPCVLGADEPGLVRITPRVLQTRPMWLAYPREARLAAPVQAVIAFVMTVMLENAERIAGRVDAVARADGL
jgi:DNA-binding transcriptional LysR family regulator